MEHVSSENISSFLAGVLSEAVSDRFESHLDECHECREIVSEVVRSRGALAHTQKQRSAKNTPTLRLPMTTGDLIDGRYRLERVLGVGGMGCVFQAHHIHLNQKVALKAMLPKAAIDESSVMRFLREARAASRLTTPHVCRVLDVGMLPSGTPYLAMELLVGESLESRLQREGRVSFAVAVKWTLQISEALQEAHAQGIVHRDLKPANLFIAQQNSGEETIKVLDFGIAKSAHPDIEAGLKQTTTDVFVGTPQYMAPEQLRSGATIDGRTDIWALGCVLHQMITGRVPFEANSVAEVMMAIAQKKHPRISEMTEAPRHFQSVLDRCLAKESADRIASVVELQDALKPFIGAESPSNSKRSTWVWSAAGVILALGIAVGIFSMRTRETTTPLTPSRAEVTPSPPPPIEKEVSNQPSLEPPIAQPVAPIAPPPSKKKLRPVEPPIAPTKEAPIKQPSLEEQLLEERR